MPHFSIPVMIDIEAPTREAAAQNIVDAIGTTGLFDQMCTASQAASGTKAGIESWWFPEAELKGIDGNDNDAFLLVDVNDALKAAEHRQRSTTWILGEVERRADLIKRFNEHLASQPTVRITPGLFGPRVTLTH